ncbi:MAG: hypothetical protein AAGG79_02345 [Pseudomonadota bacterium]
MARGTIVAAAALAVLSMIVSACGFRPLYASLDEEGAGGVLGRIELGAVRGPSDARDQVQSILSRRLPTEDGNERYTMDINLRESRRGVSVSIDNNTRRFNYQLIATVVYLDRQTKMRRVQSLTSEVSYAVVPSQYATLVGQEDAIRRAAIDIVRKIEIDAAFYAQGRAIKESDASILENTNQRDPLPDLRETTPLRGGAVEQNAPADPATKPEVQAPEVLEDISTEKQDGETP